MTSAEFKKFRNDLVALGDEVKTNKEHVNHHTDVRRLLVFPLFELLGYNLKNPLEVKTEVETQMGSKNNAADRGFIQGIPSVCS